MLESLMGRYRAFKKEKLLRSVNSYNQNYAFVGVGSHSILNLYPVIQFLGLNLKYVFSRDLSHATSMRQKWKDCTPINNIDTLCNDPATQNVFVCLRPELHFEYARLLLAAGKNIFIEKPPCKNIEELSILSQLSQGKISLVGLQKRYAPVYQTIKKKGSANALSYNYRFLTGSFPEGNKILELFLHPLDLVMYLFGPEKDLHVRKNKESIFIQIEHTQGTIGQIELSTGYNWKNACERLSVFTSKGVFETNGIYDLVFKENPKYSRIFSAERVLQPSSRVTQLINNNGFEPIAKNQFAFASGYFQEIQTFADLVEGRKSVNHSSFDQLTDTYKLLRHF